MSGLLAISSGEPAASAAAAPSQASTVQHNRSLGRVEVRLDGADSLFDRKSPPTYPHTGPMVQPAVAAFLLDSARAHRSARRLEIVVNFASPPMNSTEEDALRVHLSRYFAKETELATLDLRVNRTEGFASVRYALPVVLVAALVVGLLYAQVGEESAAGYLTELIYLAFIVIVWVMLWDPIEVLLFNSFFIRLKIRALRKLTEASVRFVYADAEAARAERPASAPLSS